MPETISNLDMLTRPLQQFRKQGKPTQAALFTFSYSAHSDICLQHGSEGHAALFPCFGVL